MPSNLTPPRVSAIYKSGPTFSSKILQTLLPQGFQPGPLFFTKLGQKWAKCQKTSFFAIFYPQKMTKKHPKNDQKHLKNDHFFNQFFHTFLQNFEKFTKKLPIFTKNRVHTRRSQNCQKSSKNYQKIGKFYQ